MQALRLCDDSNQKSIIREYPTRDGLTLFLICDYCAKSTIFNSVKFRPISTDEFKSIVNSYKKDSEDVSI